MDKLRNIYIYIYHFNKRGGSYQLELPLIECGVIGTI